MIKDIMPEDVHEQLNKGKQLNIIDVREDDEVAHGMIQGAQHIALGEVESRVNALDKNEEYIMVCRSGGRSMKAAQYLDQQGFTVKNLVGGMTAWDAKYSK